MIGLAIGVLLAAQAQADIVVVRATNPAAGDAELEVVGEVRIGSLEGAVETSFGFIVGVAVGEDRMLYVADVQASAIRMFDAEGEYLGDLGRRGEGPGEFETLRGIAALPDGEIAVWHEMDRVMVFGADGAYERGFSARLMSIGGGPGASLAADSAGHLLVRTSPGPPRPGTPLVARYSWIHISGEDGALLDSIVAPDREVANSPAAFRTETLSIPSPHEYLVTGRNDGYALHRPLSDGRVLRIERDYEPIVVEGEERSQWEAYAEALAGRRGADFPALASEKPAFQALYVDADGRIWVHRYGEAEHDPDYADPRERIGMPGVDWIEPVRHDVLDPRGTFLGTVTLPHRAEILFARGPHVWTKEFGDFDEQYVVRYRIGGW